MSILLFFLDGCAARPAPGQRPAGGLISEDYLVGLEGIDNRWGDLDHDGVKEWFLGSLSSQGQAGMNYLVLKRVGENWQPMGEIFLRPGSFRILPLAPDGSIRLLRYWHMSASSAFVDTQTYRDGAFVIINRELIHDGDGGTEEGRRRAQELFADMKPDEQLANHP
jgi:hypothetical protein